MFAGTPTLCLRSRDVERTRAFYEALGLEVVDQVPGVRVVLRSGTFTLVLMTFLEENLIRFEGADVGALYESLRVQGITLSGKPERFPPKSSGNEAAGTCWTTHDPDGNAVYFETPSGADSEASRHAALSGRLRDMERELTLLGASEACLSAFRTHVLERFGA